MIRRVRRIALAAVTIDLLLVAVGVGTYPAFFTQPGSVAILGVIVCVLLIYGGAVVIARRVTDPTLSRVLRTAALAGLALGIAEVANITIETFAALPTGIGRLAPLYVPTLWRAVSGDARQEV